MRTCSRVQGSYARHHLLPGHWNDSAAGLDAITVLGLIDRVHWGKGIGSDDASG
jgi:hypothetical protein